MIIKNEKNKEKNIGKMYSPSGKFAQQAKQVYLLTLMDAWRYASHKIASTHCAPGEITR